MNLSIDQLEVRVGSAESRDAVAGALRGLRAGLEHGAGDASSAAAPERVAVGRLVIELPDDVRGELAGQQIAHRVLEEMRNSIRRDSALGGRELA